MFEEYPDEIDNILFDTSICLANVKNTVIRNHCSDGFPERPMWGKFPEGPRPRYGKFHELFSKYSDEFYSRMNTAPPFAVDIFIDLNRHFRDLSIEDLKKLRESVKRVPDFIKSFMPQNEILKRMRNEDSINREMGGISPYYRIAQVRFIKKIKDDMGTSIDWRILLRDDTLRDDTLRDDTLRDDTESSMYWHMYWQREAQEKARKLYDIVRRVILEPSSFRFCFRPTISYQGDYPYSNWIENIADIMLNHYNCYIDMINRLIERERIERERLERERIERERLERERIERIERERLERERIERERIERIERERIERERIERERIERERVERERIERERVERERVVRERIERERVERERIERERIERERIERERVERERIERERLERERLERNCPSKNKIPSVCKTKKDFLKQSLIFHPDKNLGCSEEANEKFKLLQKRCSSVRGGQRKLKRKIKTKKRKIRITKKQKITFKKKQKYKK